MTRAGHGPGRAEIGVKPIPIPIIIFGTGWMVLKFETDCTETDRVRHDTGRDRLETDLRDSVKEDRCWRRG